MAPRAGLPRPPEPPRRAAIRPRGCRRRTPSACALRSRSNGYRRPPGLAIAPNRPPPLAAPAVPSAVPPVPPAAPDWASRPDPHARRGPARCATPRSRFRVLPDIPCEPMASCRGGSCAGAPAKELSPQPYHRRGQGITTEDEQQRDRMEQEDEDEGERHQHDLRV